MWILGLECLEWLLGNFPKISGPVVGNLINVNSRQNVNSGFYFKVKSKNKNITEVVIM